MKVLLAPVGEAPQLSRRVAPVDIVMREWTERLQDAGLEVHNPEGISPREIALGGLSTVAVDFHGFAKASEALVVPVSSNDPPGIYRQELAPVTIDLIMAFSDCKKPIFSERPLKDHWELSRFSSLHTRFPWHYDTLSMRMHSLRETIIGYNAALIKSTMQVQVRV